MKLRNLWKRLLASVLSAMLLCGGLPSLTPMADGQKAESQYPVAYTIADFNSAAMSGWNSVGSDGGVTTDAEKGEGSLYLPPVSGRQSAWCDAVTPIALTSFFESKDEIAVSVWVYTETTDVDAPVRVTLKDGAGNTAYVDLEKTTLAPTANAWHEVVLPLSAMTGNFLWESGLQQWSMARTDGTTDLWLDDLSFVTLPGSNYKVKCVLADDSVKVSGGLENTTRSISGTQSYYFHSESSSQKPTVYGGPSLDFSQYGDSLDELGISFFVYTDSLDVDGQYAFEIGSGSWSNVLRVMAYAKKSSFVSKEGVWQQVVIPLSEDMAAEGFDWTAVTQWRLRLQVPASNGSAETPDTLWVDKIEIVSLKVESPYKTKHVLADDSVKVSGNLEDTTRSISGAQSYYFQSTSSTEKPSLYSSPSIDFSQYAVSLDELAISFFVYTDSLDVDGQYAFEIGSGSWSNVLRVMAYAKKSSFVSKEGVWQQVVIPLSEDMATESFDWTAVTQWRLRLQVPASNGSAETPDTLWVDKIEIVSLEPAMEVALGEYEVVKMLEDAENEGLTLENATMTADQFYEGAQSVLLTASNGGTASVSGSFVSAVDIQSFTSQKAAMSFWLAADELLDVPVTLTLTSAEGSLAMTRSLSEVLSKAKQWRQIVFTLDQGTTTGIFDSSAVTDWTLSVENPSNDQGLKLYADALGIAELPVNPFPVKYVLADFDTVSASFTQGALNSEIRYQGQYSGRISAAKDTGNAAIYKSINSIKLSDYADRIDKLAISFWVYTDAVGEDVDLCFQLASGSWSNSSSMSYIVKDSYAPTAGKWHHVLLRLADFKNADGFDWNNVTQWRFFQHNQGEKPSWNLWVDQIELVEVPIWNDLAETENLVYFINSCDSTKVGTSNGGTSPLTYVRGPQSIRLATGNIKSSMWYAPGNTVNLSSVFYDFEDLALSVWLRSDSLENDTQLTFHLWSSGGSESKNVLKWTIDKRDVLSQKDEWTQVLLKFSDAAGDGNFDFTQYTGYSMKTTPTGSVRSNLYVDELEIISLKAFGSGDFLTTKVDKAAAQVGDTITVTVDIDNTLDKDLTNISYKLSYNELMLTTTDTLAGSLNLSNGESEQFTYTFKAQEGGAAVFTMTLQIGSVTVVSQARSDVTGRGFYLGDGHTHSTRSDGTDTLQANFLSAYSKGHSFILATDHNADPSDPSDVAQALADVREGLENPHGFIALKNNEITNTPNGHMLQYKTLTQYQPQTSAAGWQQVIQSIKSDGGMSFLAHPFYEPWLYSGLESPANVITEYADVTGFEIVNGGLATKTENRMAQEIWDRYNLAGWGRYWGVVNTDGHTKDQVGGVFNALLMDSLSEENIYDAYENGRFYGSTGPQLRYTLGGADMGSTAYIDGATGQAELDVTAYVNDGSVLTKVIAYRYAISDTIEGIEAAYQAGHSAPIVLYEQTDGEQRTLFETTQNLTVKEGEFIRVEVYAQQGIDTLVAFSNPIWVETATDEPVDTQRAQELLSQAEALDGSLYTNFSDVESAVNALNGMLANDTATQDIIDELANTLDAAMKALSYKAADYTALDAMIATVPEDLSLYTDETAQAVQNILDSIAQDKNITEQEVVDNWKTALETAVAALELKPVENPVMLGDINADGEINASDALLALQHSVKLIALEGDKAKAADVTKEGEINASDALKILQYSVRLIDEF